MSREILFTATRVWRGPTRKCLETFSKVMSFSWDAFSTAGAFWVETFSFAIYAFSSFPPGKSGCSRQQAAVCPSAISNTGGWLFLQIFMQCSHRLAKAQPLGGA